MSGDNSDRPLAHTAFGVGSTAMHTAMATMVEGKETHPGDLWRFNSTDYHLAHAIDHLTAARDGDTSEDNIAHALTRLAMIVTLR